MMGPKLCPPAFKFVTFAARAVAPCAEPPVPPEPGSEAEVPAERYGQRALAVAHELNNIFTVVRSYAHFARKATNREESARDLRVVAAAAERGTTLTDWLAWTAERETHARDHISAHDLVAACVTRLRLLVLPGTLLDIEHPSEDLALRANRARLKHVLISLVLNANQLLPGGSFTFGLRSRSIDDRQTSPLASGAYVVFTVDCRAGAEFTTHAEVASLREALAGHVSLLADLLASMNGSFTVASSDTWGTRFELYLPAASALPASPDLAAPKRPPLVNSGKTVLIVEDDSAIRLAMRRTLVSAGHSVLEASDAPAAQEILQSVAPTVRLVVSDTVLPRGDGVQLLTWIQARYPSIGCLMISGRERDGEAKARQLGVEFLGKPFYPAEFLAAVNGILSIASSVPARSESGIARPVVVVVDDDSDIRDSFQRLLSECDFETYLAKSGLHALQILAERHVDAVVTDQMMPGLDGIGLLELVYQRFPACTRILCTGYPGSDIVIGAVNRGRVQRVLPKTMHAVALRDEIERAVLESMQTRESANLSERYQTSSSEQ